MSKELSKLKKHFKANCNVKVINTIETKQYFHWKRLVFDFGLNCEELEDITSYIRYTFSTPGKYSHQLPKLGVFKGNLCLTVDAEQINDKIK